LLLTSRLCSRPGNCRLAGAGARALLGLTFISIAPRHLLPSLWGSTAEWFLFSSRRSDGARCRRCYGAPNPPRDRQSACDSGERPLSCERTPTRPELPLGVRWVTRAGARPQLGRLPPCRSLGSTAISVAGSVRTGRKSDAFSDDINVQSWRKIS